MSGGSFGAFEVLASAPDEQRLAQQQANDRLAAAIYDVREEFGDFLFKAADIREFRSRVALVKDDAIRVVDAHLMPITSVMRRIMGKAGVLEKEFKAMRKGAPFADYQDFDDCTSRNADKGDPSAYCGEIKHRTEDKHAFAPPQYEDDLVAPPMSQRPPSGEAVTAPQGRSLGEKPTAPSGQGVYWGEDPIAPGLPTEKQHAQDFRSREHDLDKAHGMPDADNWMKDFHGPGLSVQTNRRRATGDGPPLHTDETFQDHQEQPLIPEGDFKGYLDSVDQGAPSKVDDAFVSNPDATRHTEDPANTDFVARRARRVFAQYLKFCRSNRLPLTLKVLERHGKKLTPPDYLLVAAGLDQLSRTASSIPQNKVLGLLDVLVRKGSEGAGSRREARIHTAVPDYLQKATDALTQFLQQCAEQFQTEIGPMQQALQVVQQAQALSQAANPMSVTPPAGTINVLPEPPAGMAGPAGPPAADPAADPSAPPPAAAAGGGLPQDDPTLDPTAGLPPDPNQQSVASRRRGSELTPGDIERTNNPHSPDGQWTPPRQPHDHNGSDNGYCTSCGLPQDHFDHFAPPPSMRQGRGGHPKARRPA